MPTSTPASALSAAARALWPALLAGDDRLRDDLCLVSASGHRLLYEGVPDDLVRRVNRSFLFGPLTYGVAALIALANSWISLAIYAGLALYWLLPTSGASLDAPTTPREGMAARIRRSRRA